MPDEGSERLHENAEVMKPIIRIDLQRLIDEERPIVIELGCGPRKTRDRIGIDKLDAPAVDIVADVEEGLSFLPDHSVDEIHSRSFFEHVENLEQLMREIVRVLKHDGTCHVFVPHFSNPYFYSDYTHKKFMGLYTFYYFVEERFQLERKVPNFYTDVRIKILSQRLIFGNPAKKARFKKVVEHIVNSTTSMQEFYEENLCYILPCYGLQLTFTADNSTTAQGVL